MELIIKPFVENLAWIQESALICTAKQKSSWTQRQIRKDWIEIEIDWSEITRSLTSCNARVPSVSAIPNFFDLKNSYSTHSCSIIYSGEAIMSQRGKSLVPCHLWQCLIVYYIVFYRILLIVCYIVFCTKCVDSFLLYFETVVSAPGVHAWV